MSRRHAAALLALGAVAFGTPVAGNDAVAPGAVAQAAAAEVVISVAGEGITRARVEQAYAAAVRSKFYHGTPPQDQLDALRREVAAQLIDRVLLLQEGRRRGLRPDQAAVGETLAGYETRYASSPRFQQQREQLLPLLAARLGEDDLLRQLETRVRAVDLPQDADLEAFYEQFPEKFTEPGQQRLSVILLSVAPHAPREQWEAAQARAAELAARITRGENFAALAREFSADASAADGGDMGYLHEGMLSPPAQAVLRELPLGEVSAPVRLLEGIALFRVDDRRPARLVGFAEVRERARGLWLRERSEAAWREFKAGLRAAAAIEVLDPTLLRAAPQPAAATADASG